MEAAEASDIISKHGVRPTAIRTLIWRTIEDMGFAFSMGDIEAVHYTIDRSTIFRTLTTFVEHHMLHTVDDGSGLQKYCIAADDTNDQHVHITCQFCHKTYCCKAVRVPIVKLPEGFDVKEVSYVVKGICKDCKRKGKRFE